MTTHRARPATAAGQAVVLAALREELAAAEQQHADAQALYALIVERIRQQPDRMTGYFSAVRAVEQAAVRVRALRGEIADQEARAAADADEPMEPPGEGADEAGSEARRGEAALDPVPF
jgi:hypothetical protein